MKWGVKLGTPKTALPRLADDSPLPTFTPRPLGVDVAANRHRVATNPCNDVSELIQ